MSDAYAEVRYKASLKFAFPKGFKPTTDQVGKIVADVFSVQPNDDVHANTRQGTSTISLGDSLAEVEAVLGPPDNALDVGPKKIYVYKDLKITFLNGKVSDIQ